VSGLRIVLTWQSDVIEIGATPILWGGEFLHKGACRRWVTAFGLHPPPQNPLAEPSPRRLDIPPPRVSPVYLLISYNSIAYTLDIASPWRTP